MVLHLRSLGCSYVNLLGLAKRGVVVGPGCICSITTSSNDFFEESSCLGASEAGHQEGRKQVGTDSELDFIISYVHPGSSPEDVFQSLLRNVSCNTVNITHRLLGKLLFRFKDDWKSALGVFRWAQSHPGYEPLPEIYDKLIHTLGKMKQMEQMNTILREMHEANVISFKTMFKVMGRLCDAREWEQAIKIFDELENYGFKKNTETMNILLNSLCKEERVEQARNVFLKFKSHVRPNANTFNILLFGWCKIYRVDEANWTIQEMKGYGFRPCVISYTNIIKMYCQKRYFPEVYELLDEMQAEGCPPNVSIFTRIMSSLTNSQMYDEALQIPERMKSIGCKPNTFFFNVFLRTLERAGLVRRAIRVFKFEMPDNFATPNTLTYNLMIAMFCHHAQEEKALQYLQRMENSPHCNPDVNSYSPLFKLYLEAKKFDVCRQLLDDMVNKHHLLLDLATYTLLINGLCRGRQYEWAYLLFKEMIGKGITPRYQTCRLLLEEMRLKNMVDAAEIVEHMNRIKPSTASSMSDNIDTST